MACFICEKHEGKANPPPGGYIYEDNWWMVCHAPLEKGPLGTLFIESKRHILDFGEFDEEESRSFGSLSARIYRALRSELAPERIYQLSMMEGQPHFHAWIVPRMKDISERGVAFLAKDLNCEQKDVEKLVIALRKSLEG